MKHLLIVIALFLNIASGCQSDGGSNTEEQTVSGPEKVTYAVSNEVFTNPERGFMHTWQVNSEGAAITAASLNNLKKENVSLILRLYYLEKFKTTPLSQAQLDLIKTDFTRLRESGLKCVLRFAYTDAQDGTDASVAVISGHLDQLKPILEENKDVIAFVQAGFVGAWGEWYYTTNQLTTPANKKIILDKLLATFPKEVKIQVRTPKIKQDFVATTTAMDATVGYGTTNTARLGFHNDCFMASVDDYGTYINVTAEKTYISNEALFVPTGGETCPPTDVPVASCSIAEKEMTMLKWTYLNLDYYGPVLQEWRNNNCFTDFERKLGYRLALASSSIKKEIALNGTLEFNALLNNSGFAPIYNSKNTFLILRATSGGTVYKKKLNFDVRKVVPKVTYDLKESVALSGIPAGTYELLLKIEDNSSKLADRPDYSVRLANTGVWEAATGFNKLSQTVIIK
ncbi:DUF4832 domain-containing protein [Flavobacterium circumlabens]|uniref:DUF4832 domain-containing protein n=1 Tax=Flavobacterium circumlabens TaxID=2133765 RepID=A0A4Y7U6H4_9FLAO|nr:DUF4832 domain-containing protein [Flavobacterium circumlabens]TCN50666.1 uncharacterized protein DUF4874 [Flavobacterium circumlabens]TEB41851.1 DUF4832 domain-containing protein [Flavobacterium circumlabens]